MMWITKKDGFSFIELLLVIAIMSVLGVIGAGAYARLYIQNDVTTVTDHLVSQLRKAQLYAMMGKQSGGVWGVRYETNPSKSLVLFLNGSSSFDETLRLNNSVSITGFTQIIFAHNLGLPTPTGPTTITITGPGSSESITVSSQGVVSKN